MNAGELKAKAIMERCKAVMDNEPSTLTISLTQSDHVFFKHLARDVVPELFGEIKRLRLLIEEVGHQGHNEGNGEYTIPAWLYIQLKRSINMEEESNDNATIRQSNSDDDNANAGEEGT